MTDQPINTTFGVDTREFKTGMAELSRQIRIAESEFRSIAAGMEDWEASSAGLEARIKSLGAQITAQQAKVAAYQAAWQKVAAEQGANSKAAQDLQIKINKETETLNRMQTELRQTTTALDATGKETKDTGDQTQDLQKHEERAVLSTERLGNSMRGLTGHLKSAASGMVHLAGQVAKLTAGLAIGLAGAATAAGVGLVALAKTTIGPASDLNETVSKVNVVFGDAADTVLKFGQQSATGMGMSTNAALTAAGTYGNLFRAMGMTNATSADMSVNLVKLAGDLASFNNLNPEDVLEKLRAGLTGETEPLKSLGVNISAAAVKAQALKMGLKEVNGELPAAAKAQATYALILEQTALAQGDFARTSGGLANQQRILSSNVENLKAKIGTALLPIVTQGTEALNKFLTSSMMTDAVEWLTTKIGELSGKFDEIVDKLSTGNVRGALNSIFGREVVDKAIQLKDEVGRISDKIGGLIGQVKTGGIGSLFENLIPKGGAGGLAVQLSEKIGEILAGAITGVASKPALFLQAGLNILNGLATALATAIPALLPVGIQLLNSLVTFITTSIPQLIPAGLQVLLGLVDAILANLPMLIETALQLIITLAMGITKALPELIPRVLEIVPKIVLTLLSNIPQIIQAALELILALATGLINAIPVLLPYVPQIIQAVFDALITSLPLIGQAAVELIMTLVTGIMDNLPKIGATAVELLGALQKGMQGLTTQILEVGAGIVTGVWNGIISKKDEFFQDIKDFFAGMLQAAKDAIGWKSPPKKFRELGAGSASAFGLGFEDQFPAIERQIRQAMTGMTALQFSPAVSGAYGQIDQQMAPVYNINIQGTPEREMDMRKLARYVADEVQRNQR